MNCPGENAIEPSIPIGAEWQSGALSFAGGDGLVNVTLEEPCSAQLREFASEENLALP